MNLEAIKGGRLSYCHPSSSTLSISLDSFHTNHKRLQGSDRLQYKHAAMIPYQRAILLTFIFLQTLQFVF